MSKDVEVNCGGGEVSRSGLSRVVHQGAGVTPDLSAMTGAWLMFFRNLGLIILHQNNLPSKAM
jgi:hypothetical protein